MPPRRGAAAFDLHPSWFERVNHIRGRGTAMKTADDGRGMRIQFDAHHCAITPHERDQYRGGLAALARQVAHFPISDLHILIEFNKRSNDYSVKTTLILPGSRLVANDHDPVAHAAFLRCLAVMSENVAAYKKRMSHVPQLHRQEKGTVQEVQPLQEPDFAAMGRAVETDDYDAFRTAALPYEDAVRRRAGRWVERVPEVAAQMGRVLDVGDIVEAVFLEAFEHYRDRQRDVRFGDWLDGLIDPAVRALYAGGSYMENVRLARTARAALERQAMSSRGTK
jgi:ribosome-associated translation inhibitor RaiA